MKKSSYYHRSRIRNFLLSLCLLLSFSLFQGIGRGEEPEGLVSFDFNGADIGLVIKFVSEISGIDFIVDPRVKGQVTVISPTRIPAKEVYQVLQSILEVQGFTIVPSGRMVKIVPSVEAKQKSIRTEVGKEIKEISPGDAMVTQIIPLEYADANEVRAILTPLASRSQNMTIYPPTNTLIFTDTSSNIRRLLTIVKEIDVRGPRIEREVISLRYASALALSAAVTQAIQKQPARGKKIVQKKLKIIPDERTNSLIVVADSGDMREIKTLVGRLDKETPAALSKVNIYYLENANAEELAKVLDGVNVGLKRKSVRLPSRRGAPSGGEQPNIVADKATNSLIITASPEDQAMFKIIIKKLDIMRDQVLVEMLIAEVSMDLTRKLGIELATLDKPEAGSVRGFGGTDFTSAIQKLAAGQPPGLSGLVAGLMKGQTALGGLKVGALLQAYQKNSDFNVLATPQILTSDNEEAEIKIGENIPYVKDYRITELDTITKTWAYKDVGIDLKITPQINQKGFVRMKVYGKITKLVEDSAAETPTTVMREAKTIVSVEDGHTLVIGGLIRNDKEKSLKKVPILGDIPILGWLFKRREETTVKRNLLIFITPHVITSVKEMEGITKKKKREQKESIDKSAKRDEKKIEK